MPPLPHMPSWHAQWQISLYWIPTSLVYSTSHSISRVLSKHIRAVDLLLGNAVRYLGLWRKM